jgi:ribosomal protein L7/L12
MSLNLEQLTDAVSIINSEVTDHKYILSKLLKAGKVTIEDIYAIVLTDDITINNLDIARHIYNECVFLNKNKRAIEAIKLLRDTYNNLGLKDAKEINDVIKDNNGIGSYYD